MRVQMLGLCRFSYLGMRGYQREHASIEDRRAFLYDPARLQRRWFWFRNVALPALTVQSDPDFTLVIMTGPDLPEPWLGRLRRLCDQHPQFRLALLPPMDRHLDACLAAIAPQIDRDADVIGHFRHDDDDAIAFDYIERARADFAPVAGLWADRGRQLCVDHARGIMADVRGGDLTLTPRICHNMGVAMTLFLPPDLDRTALHFEHWKVSAWMPNVQIPAPPMFLRLIHQDADSGSMGAGFAWDATPERLAALLPERFGIDPTRLIEGARRFA